MIRSRGTPTRLKSFAATSAVVLTAVVLAGCATTYYSFWERLGKEKRDLLRDNVEEVKEDQQQVREEFSSALEEVRALYGLEAGQLEAKYDTLSARLDSAEEEAGAFRERIDDIEEIAADLFEEWEAEIERYHNPALRAKSRERLHETRARYANLDRALRRSEAQLDPVLQALRDQVLFLKHNLNAQAVGRLEVEARDIEQGIQTLIEELERSIEQTDAFIEEL
jgi:outer membrane murein-binding lipoprotein Lpp